MNDIVKKICQKLSNPDLVNELTKELSTSELNSLLLEVSRQKAAQVSPAKLMFGFAQNRFVQPSDIDPIRLKMLEIKWLDIALNHNFQPITLSPLAPLGTCSVTAHVNQNNVVSAGRNTEIVADATNVLALKICQDFNVGSGTAVTRYIATHRHVRGQYFDNPLWSAHFGILCMASGGLDTGNHQFELDQLHEHIQLCSAILTEYFTDNKLILKILLKKNSESIKMKIQTSANRIWNKLKYEFVDDSANDYYQQVQFKFFVLHEGKEVNLADGGLVNWGQKLLSNHKHRLFISGIGTDLILRITN